MSLFDSIKKTTAVYLDGYVSFDENLKFAVQILDEDGKETDMKVFETKEIALDFIKTYNN